MNGNVAAVMSRSTAATATPLSVDERKARVEKLVASGKLTRRQAELIRFDEEIPDTIRKAAAKLAPVAKRALAKAAQHRQAA
ncbi:MAG: hypothetical protein WDN28_29915 [Chthoniobacter sp.]